MPQLMAVAEYVDKTLAICMRCGAPANRTPAAGGSGPCRGGGANSTRPVAAGASSLATYRSERRGRRVVNSAFFRVGRKRSLSMPGPWGRTAVARARSRFPGICPPRTDPHGSLPAAIPTGTSERLLHAPDEFGPVAPPHGARHHRNVPVEYISIWVAEESVRWSLFEGPDSPSRAFGRAFRAVSLDGTPMPVQRFFPPRRTQRG